MTDSHRFIGIFTILIGHIIDFRPVDGWFNHGHYPPRVSFPGSAYSRECGGWESIRCYAMITPTQTRHLYGSSCLVKNRLLVCLLIILLLPACVEVKEHLTLDKDGSGHLMISVRSDTSSGDILNLFGVKADGLLRTVFPPLDENSIRKLFPGDTFIIETNVGKSPEPDESPRIPAHEFHAIVRFRDLNDLIESPYGKIKKLELIRDDGVIRCRMVSGLDLVIFALTTQKMENWPGVSNFLLEQGKKRSDFSFVYTIDFPTVVRSTTGRVNETGKSVTWKMDTYKINTDKHLVNGLKTIMTAECSPDGFPVFLPSPPRLGLDPYSLLKEREITITNTLPPVEKIRHLIQFVPSRLLLR